MSSNVKPRPILVTGSHRSGTTWVGHMLRMNPELGYIFEPFNIEMNDIGMGVCERMERNYLYLGQHNEHKYQDRLDKLMAFQYPTAYNLSHPKSLKSIGKTSKDTLNYLSHKWNKRQPLVKDPLAFFSTPWLAERYDMAVVIMLRHPSAFCSSLKVKNWHFNYDNFLNQPELMDAYLNPYRERIEACKNQEADIIDQGILIWNCIHHTVLKFKEKNPDWIFLRHEDISFDPANQFKALCEKLNVSYTTEMETAIIASSGSHNPSEQTKNEFVRDSRKNIKNWKNRLDTDEIARIRAGTEHISAAFYHESDW